MTSSDSKASLQRLAEAGRLKLEPAADEEIAGLLGVAATSLADARRSGLSVQGKFQLAYGAAHALALAALRAQGFRPARGEGHRAIVFQALPHTADAPPEAWVSLDKAHRKRNDLEYNAIAAFSRSEADSLVELAAALDTRVRAMLARERPKSLKEK